MMTDKTVTKLSVRLLMSLLASCSASPSYAIASSYEPFINDTVILFDLVARTGNTLHQELQNLFKHVQHHTIVDVFLCLSILYPSFFGAVSHALALVRLWWGGDGNKPFIRRILSAVCLTVLNLPATLTLGQIITLLLPVRKVQTND